MEINGHVGSGKSLLLVDMIARVILDERHGGCAGHVVLFDLDHRWNFFRLVDTLKATIRAGDETNREETLLECLERLTVVACHSLSRLID